MKCTVIKADDSEIEIEHRNIFCGYGAVSFVNKAGSICSYYDAARSEDCFFFVFTCLIPRYMVKQT
jgi:hypothetical protein